MSLQPRSQRLGPAQGRALGTLQATGPSPGPRSPWPDPRAPLVCQARIRIRGQRDLRRIRVPLLLVIELNFPRYSNTVLESREKWAFHFRLLFAWVSSKDSKTNFANFPLKSIEDTISDNNEFKNKTNKKTFPKVKISLNFFERIHSFVYSFNKHLLSLTQCQTAS